ncbi:MAG: XRE family transcriptional regulator [Myxococcaceae bacterium]|nr:MAG: XRE family transcriptional regulator [Myxococcaceae bacterium]
MPRSTAATHFQHSHLGSALRWLREHRASLTRAQAVEGCGRAVSEPYLRKIENGERNTMARDKLNSLLTLYGSSEPELEALLAAESWQGPQSDRAWKPSKTTPAPSAYRAAAAGALADLTDAGTWSTTVDNPAVARRVRGQATELVEHFVRLSAPDREELLDAVRAKRYGDTS